METKGGAGSGPVFAYKKDDVEDALFAGVAKKTSRRNSRNERRNSKVGVGYLMRSTFLEFVNFFQAKVLNHNPEIYSQFLKFNLSPPASNKEVVAVIGHLKEKQVDFFCWTNIMLCTRFIKA